jgi:hypothetical protein
VSYTITFIVLTYVVMVGLMYLLLRQGYRIARLNAKLRDQAEAATGQALRHADEIASYASELRLADAEVRRLADELERRQLGSAS